MIKIVPREDVIKEIENGSVITVIYPHRDKPDTFGKQKVENMNKNSFSYPKQVKLIYWLQRKIDNGDEMIFIKYEEDKNGA